MPHLQRKDGVIMQTQESGKYVVYEVYRTHWQHEEDNLSYLIMESPEAVATYIIDTYGDEGYLLIKAIADDHPEFNETFIEELKI